MLKKKRGFTLIEILIALVVLSMGITLLITMFTVGMKGVIANQERTQATNLAQDLMDEILGKEFRDPNQTPGWGVESGEDVRSEYDDVDDYSAWKNENPPKKVTGESIGTAYAAFTRNVSVFNVDASFTGAAEGTTYSIKEIIVSVSHSDITTVSLYGLKTKSVY